jgi:hypothetical protein
MLKEAIIRVSPALASHHDTYTSLWIDITFTRRGVVRAIIVIEDASQHYKNLSTGRAQLAACVFFGV